MDERNKEDYTKYYEKIELIDSGAFGHVYKGKIKGKDEYRAIKVINLDKIRYSLSYEYEDENDIENILNNCIDGYKNEYENMRICSINNNNSVKCYEYFYNREEFVIIMELCDKNLSQLLLEKKKNNKVFDIKEIKEIMKQLNKTLRIMKDNKIIHRDL